MDVLALINSPDEPIPMAEDGYYRRTNRKEAYVQGVKEGLK